MEGISTMLQAWGFRLRKLARRAFIATVLAAAAWTLVHAAGLNREMLWPVVRVCVADARLTGSPWPCNQVDLKQGELNGTAVLQPPMIHDLIVVPTRRVTGVEDPLLQTEEAPRYFASAWSARVFLQHRDGTPLEWDEVGMVANSAKIRSQDQLHIHVGCLHAAVRRAVAEIAPIVPTERWKQLSPIVPHLVFWGRRIAQSALTTAEPFQAVAELLGDQVVDLTKLTIGMAGIRVDGAQEFLMLASYAGAPHSWWQVGADDLLNASCS